MPIVNRVAGNAMDNASAVDNPTCSGMALSPSPLTTSRPFVNVSDRQNSAVYVRLISNAVDDPCLG